MDSNSRLVVGSFITAFQSQKQMAEKAVNQLPDDQLHRALDDNTNSLAVIMKHMAGNLRSRFTDFLTTDGEKPDRDRDSEFVDDAPGRAALMSHWEQGWKCLFDALAPLSDADLARTITIRGQPHSVADALARALAHQGYHVGQIVQLARFLAKDRWQTLTIPRGGSRGFNDTMQKKHQQ
ncbi:MAG TPA: DinB family protein [Phycisphaerae bacterium]|nr:DinB family protein [Phycisphaerae bacterium]